MHEVTFQRLAHTLHLVHHPRCSMVLSTIFTLIRDQYQKNQYQVQKRTVSITSHNFCTIISIDIKHCVHALDMVMFWRFSGIPKLSEQVECVAVLCHFLTKRHTPLLKGQALDKISRRNNLPTFYPKFQVIIFNP